MISMTRVAGSIESSRWKTRRLSFKTTFLAKADWQGGAMALELIDHACARRTKER